MTANAALVQLQKARKGLAPLQSDLKTSLAAAHAAQGQLDPARAAADAALRAVPNHAAALVALARIDASQGEIAGRLLRLDGVVAQVRQYHRTAQCAGLRGRLGKCCWAGDQYRHLPTIMIVGRLVFAIWASPAHRPNADRAGLELDD